MITAAMIQAIYPDISIGVVGAGSGCALVDGVIVEWSDPRPQPTQHELESAAVPAARLAKIAELKRACTTAIQSGFTSAALGTPHTYDSELPTDQTNIIGAMVASLSGATIPFTCTDSNGYKEQRLHTSAQLQQVFQAGMQHIVINKSHYDSLKKTVEQATTLEEINGVTW